MNLTKSDFIITSKAHDCYTVSTRQYIFWLIPIWTELSYSSTENSDEEILEFKSFQDANEFINIIIQNNLDK